MERDDAGNAGALRCSRCDVGHRAGNTALEVGDINPLTAQERSNRPECFSGEWDVEWK
jgi:hypothetical protein